MQKISADEGKRTFHLPPGQDLGCFSRFLHSLLKLQGSTSNAQGWEMTLFPSRTSSFESLFKDTKCTQHFNKIKPGE